MADFFGKDFVCITVWLSLTTLPAIQKWLPKSFVPPFWKQFSIANKYQGRRKKERSVGGVSGNGTPIVFRPWQYFPLSVACLFQICGILLINARSLRDGPAFYHVTFGDLKRKGLHRWTSGLIKRISPIVLNRKITNSILHKSLFSVCVFGG